MTGFRRLPLESYPPFQQSSADLVRDAMAAAEVFKGFLLAENWDGLYSHSATLMGLADLLLRRIHCLSALEDAWGDSLSERDHWLRSAFADLSTDDSAEAEEIRAAMLAKLTDLSGDGDQARAFLDRLLTGDDPLLSSRPLAKSAVSSEQEALVRPQVILATLANRAAVESSIFKAHERLTAMGIASPGEDADNEIIASVAATLRILHDDTVQSLFTMLGSDAERDEFIGLCVARQAQIAARLPTSAMMLGGYLALVADNRDSVSQAQQYRAALAVTEWVRRLSILHAYASLARAEAATVDPGRWYSNERRRVATRVAESHVPSGQETRISDLGDGQLEDGSLVEVEGWVENLVISDDPSPPKFSTFFNLTNAASGDSVVVRAHMFSLINNGLTNGAYVRLSGHLRLSPDWADDIGVDIDRVPLTELRGESWYDDVTHRVRTYAQLYLDEMNMFFTPPLGE